MGRVWNLGTAIEKGTFIKSLLLKLTGPGPGGRRRTTITLNWLMNLTDFSTAMVCLIML